MVKKNIILLLVILLSCNTQNSFVTERIKTAEKFLNCLENNQSDSILKYSIIGANVFIDDKELRDFHVNVAHQYIQKYSLPSKEKWKINYNPNNNFERLIITIPLFKGRDSTSSSSQINIRLFFPPQQIGDKIYKYEVDNQPEINRIGSEPPTQIPDSI
jgi:hypothetical protein